MNASLKTIKRSLATRTMARRVANWGVLMVALGQTACDEDPDPWTIVDGGVDASVTADGGVDSTIPGPSSAESTGTPTGNISVEIPTETSESTDEGTPDGSATEPTELDASASSSPATTGAASSSETTPEVTATSEPVQGTSTEVTTSSEPSTSEPDASAATGGETSAVRSSSEPPIDATDAGVPDAAAPGLEVCGSVIDEAQGISLAQALENYHVPDAGAGDAGDGGVALADCYPPCIAALLNACPARSSECSISYGYDSNTACWENGAAQTEQYTFGESLVVADAVYLGSAPCISGVMNLSYETGVSTYVWYDGTGAQVATGTDESEELVVTCTDTNESHPVDRYACSWLGQVLYSPSYCSYDY